MAHFDFQFFNPKIADDGVGEISYNEQDKGECDEVADVDKSGFLKVQWAAG